MKFQLFCHQSISLHSSDTKGRKMSKYSVKNRWLNKCLGGLAIRFIQSWLVQTDQSCGAFHPSSHLQGITLSVCLPPVVTLVSLPFLLSPWICSGRWRYLAHCRSWLAVFGLEMKLSMAVYERDKVEQGSRERDQAEPHLLPRWPPFTSSCFSFSICSWKEWHMIPGSQSVRNIFVKYWEMVKGLRDCFSLRGQITLHPMGKKLQTPGIFFNWKRFLYLKKYLYFFIYQWMLSHETHCNGST